MIHLVYGNNRDKVLARSKEVVDNFLRFNKDALHFKFTVEDFSLAKLEELVGGQSLFSQKIIVLCDGLMEDAETVSFIHKKIEEISSSGNTFVFREGELNKKEFEVFNKTAAEIEEFGEKDAGKQGYAGAREVKLKAGYENFNIFNFTDAIGAKDRKIAWVLYQKAFRAGIPVEELFWKLVWLFKNIILTSSVNTNQKDLVSKLRISPFVINKSRGSLKNYSTESLVGIYKKLIFIYHQFRRGNTDIEVALEQFILNL